MQRLKQLVHDQRQQGVMILRHGFRSINESSLKDIILN